MRDYLRKFIQNSWAVFIFILLFDGALLWKTGPAAIAADAKWYADAAHQLVALQFNFSTYFSQIQSPISPVFYITFVTLVALCQKLLGAYWLQGVLLVNVGALACSGTLVVRLVLRLTKQKSAAFIALLLFLSCLEMFNWARFVLTDTIFMALSCALFYSLARAVTAEVPQTAKKHALLALVLLFLAPFSRPTGVILFPIVAVLYFARIVEKARIINRRPLLLAVIGFLFFISVADAYLMQDIRRWPLPGAEALRLPYYAKLYHGGVMINARPETYAAPPQSLFEFLALNARRLVYFFAFWSSKGYSRGHNLALAVFFVPVYFLSLKALINGLRRCSNLAHEAETALLMACVFVLGFAFFHAHTEIDYDWRYRLPVLPPLIFIAALGFASRGAVLKAQ